MGLEDEICNLVNTQSDQNNTKIFSKTVTLKTNNDSELRRDQKRVNDSILKSTMKEWTSTVDNPDQENTNNVESLGIHKSGDKNIWQAHKEFIANEKSFGGDIMRLLYRDLDKSNTVSEEDKSVGDIARLQTVRTSRLHHEQLMAKSRMGRKIKSKGFHRHLKRREMKEFLKKDETEKNPDKLQEKLEEFEKIRAKERISLKHKTGGRFAKIQKLRAKYDPIARDALNAMHDKARELTVRARSPTGGEDSSADETDTEMVESVSGEEDTDEDPEMMASRSGEYKNSQAHKARHFVETMGSAAKKAERNSTEAPTLLSTDQTTFLQRDSEDEDDDAPVANDDQSKFKQTIFEMYQDDATLAEEFEREKRNLVSEERPEDLQTFVPGWGSWTGPGFEAADKRRKKRGLIKAPTGPRKDAKKNRLWIRQGVHDGLKRHLIKDIPYPYNTAEQFELSRKERVSSAFNLQTVHRQLIKPKFENAPGKHIYPIQKHEKRVVQ